MNCISFSINFDTNLAFYLYFCKKKQLYNVNNQEVALIQQTLNKGNAYPFKYDYPHQMNILLNYRINDILTLTTTWSYHTGNAITMSFEKYQLQGNMVENELKEIHIYDGRNTYRMPDYHRLDIGLNIKQKKGSWTLGVYNVYNRQNPYFYYFTKVDHVYKMKQATLFTFLPSISYSYSF